MGCGFDHLRMRFCLIGNLVHHLNKGIEGGLTFRFGRFNHERLMEQQGEVDGGRMVAIVQQAFGHIERGHFGAFVLDKLMLAQPLDGQFVSVFESFFDIVGIEHRERPDFAQLVTAHREQIGISAHQYRVIAQET